MSTQPLLDIIDSKFDLVKSKMERVTITENGCWEWQGPLRNKYAVCSFKYLGKSIKIGMSRMSYAFHNGIDPGEMLVCHECDNTICINPGHLFLGTNKDNSDDKIKKGRFVSLPGSKNPNSKHTEDQVIEAAKLLNSHTPGEIAEITGITRYMVYEIRSGRAWSSVTAITPKTSPQQHDRPREDSRISM